jgi:hypothetical protein
VPKKNKKKKEEEKGYEETRSSQWRGSGCCMDCVVEGIIEAKVSFLSCYLLLLFGGWFVLDVYAWMRFMWALITLQCCAI